jgi:NADH:ubiquinone oxidoreductase subunit 5 (subunit L)/multisubunit Na+/H+ antiporter MnhA subunit
MAAGGFSYQWFGETDQEQKTNCLSCLRPNLASFIFSLIVFWQVKENGGQVVTYFDFISVRSLHVPFAFQIDQLSAIFLLIITGVGFLIHVYSAST